ncbi:glycosyltransferase [Lactobacillus delbrueckii subsp. lactis]|nr:glycosyltransferase [Lactobacillus delbrueckii subsp. lactis]
MFFIGNDFFRKGGAQLIDALESLRSDQIRSDQIRSEFHLTLISSLGYGDYASHATQDDYLHYKYKIEKSDWITWYQNVPNDQVIAMLKNMQVGFLPTLADTFGFSVLEMQAAGVPVVTTNVRAMPEINNTQCGWLCELLLNPVSREAILDENLQSCKDLLEKQLKTVLAEILTHPDEISSKAINSYERIEKYHDPIKYGQILEEIYYS